MKKNVLQTLIIVMSSLMLLSFASNNRNYQTESVTIETDGYVTINKAAPFNFGVKLMTRGLGEAILVLGKNK